MITNDTQQPYGKAPKEPDPFWNSDMASTIGFAATSFPSSACTPWKMATP